MTKIKCECGGNLTLSNTRYRNKSNTIKRYYKCSNCGKKIETLETIFDGWIREKKIELAKQKIKKILETI